VIPAYMSKKELKTLFQIIVTSQVMITRLTEYCSRNLMLLCGTGEVWSTSGGICQQQGCGRN
jgi:hypothetical protein